MKKKKFLRVVRFLAWFGAILLGSIYVQAAEGVRAYYYLTGTEWNMGTDDTWVFTPYAVHGLTRDYVGQTFTTNTEVISEYTDGMNIYVRPGTALRFNTGPNWKQTDVWSAENANAGIFVHDGWEWAVADGAGQAELYNVMLIEQQTQYKTIDVAITINPYTDDSKDITMHIHVVPQNVVEKLENVLEREHSNETTDALDSLYIKTLPVTLYDYNGLEFNKQYPNNFQFRNVTQGIKVFNGETVPYLYGINEGGAQIKQGIFQAQLDEDSLPVPAFGLTNTNLFTDTSDQTKTVYKDVAFQFIFDKDTNYYTYSSMLNHAQYNESSHTVELYRQSMGTVEYEEFQGKQNWGGFYPFTDINTAFTHSKASAFLPNQDLLAWAETLKTTFDQNSDTQYYAQVVKDLVRTEQTASEQNPKVSTVNMHFGMKLQVNFYLPEGKKNGADDLIFQFTGDDDMWVFIDGKLVLDMGGGHTAQSGSINFTTGECYVQYASVLTGTDSMTQAGEIRTTDTYLQELYEDQMHTMTVFYLERFSGESNCYMRFNLPVIPDNEVHVTKKLTDQNGETLSVKPDLSYRFKLFAKGQNMSEFTSLNGYSYTVNGEARVTAEDGSFSLKDGETAVFSNIERFTTVYAVEYLDDGTYEYTKVQAGSQIKLSSEADMTEHMTQQETIQLANGIGYTVQNYMLTEKFTVSKEVVGGAEGLIDLQQQFVFRLCIQNPIVGNVAAVKQESDGTQYPVTIEMTRDVDTGFFYGTFYLKQGEQLSVLSMPVHMSYSIEELEPQQYAGSFAAPVYTRFLNQIQDTQSTLAFGNAFAYVWQQDSPEAAPLQIQAGGENKIVVTNLQRGNLVIEKEGWEEADQDQTFLFHIKGVEGTHTAGVDLTVRVMENGKIVIKDMIVGRYTVTEDEEWSWRYEADEETYKVETAGYWFGTDASACITVKNERTERKWFDGNNWCQNIFKTSKPKVD